MVSLLKDCKSRKIFWYFQFVQKLNEEREKIILRALRIVFFSSFVRFFEELRKPKIAFEIYLPLSNQIIAGFQINQVKRIATGTLRITPHKDSRSVLPLDF